MGQHRRSLIKKLLGQIVFRLGLVVIVGTLVAYYIAYRHSEKSVLESIEKYVSQRAELELETFKLAIDNHKMIHARYLENVRKYGTTDPIAEFSNHFKAYPDGVIRNRDENFDGKAEPGAFFGKEVEFTPELRRRALALCEAVRSFGPAWRNRFQNTYFIAPENFSCLYWPEEQRYLMTQGPEFHIPSEEFFTVANEKNNPARKTVSTGLYIDPGTKTAMISLVTPFYDQDRLLAVVGHDIELNSLIRRTINDSIEGAYNVIFRSDGRLVAHPTKMKEIEEKKGVYKMQESDPELKSLFETVVGKKGTTVVEQKEFDRYLTAFHLPGPDWYFVTIYPGKLVRAEAIRTSSITLAVGLFTLILELWILFIVLRRCVSVPLQQLISSTEGIRKGNFETEVNFQSNDEIGQLAEDYRLMVTELKRRNAEISRHTSGLEEMVEERTMENENQRAQIESSARLVALGEMAGGIAHEINNPLAIIQGSAEIIKRLAQEDSVDIKKLVNLTDRILLTSDRIGIIITGLRNIAREGIDDPMELADLGSIIDEVLAVCGSRLSHQQIAIDCSGIDPGTKINCRRVQMQQVLINLLNNSLDAVSSMENSWVRITVEKDKEVIRIRLTDSGPGIPDAIADKVLMPFFTTKPIGKGTGIGLSISAGMIAGHNGKLYLDRKHPNTSFVIELQSVT